MGIFDFFKGGSSKQKSNWVEVDDHGIFYSRIASAIGSTKSVESFDPCKSMYFSTSLAEIFIPIDIVASRVKSVHFEIVDKNDEPIDNLPDSLQKLLKRPNPFTSLSELIYQIVFSEIATGESYILSKMPSSYKTLSYDRITNIWTLNPDLVRPIRKDVISDPFMAKDMSDFLKGYKYDFIIENELTTKEVFHNSISTIGTDYKAQSPLLAVTRNVNNLLQVYSARFNVYSKNGKSGIVYKDTKGNSLEEQVDPATRQDILDDISNKDGLTGDRNFVGISAFPLGFVETMGKIKDLEPFKETYIDAITIAGRFGIDKELIPKEASTTFSNKKDTEKHLWQNTIIKSCYDVAETLTKTFGLPEDWKFKPNFDKVEILQSDRKMSGDADKVELENIITLKELGVDTSKRLEEWKD